MNLDQMGSRFLLMASTLEPDAESPPLHSWDKHTWKEKQPLLAKYPSRCHVCETKIKKGSRIAWKPTTYAEHWECHLGKMIRVGREFSGIDGTRKYTTQWLAGPPLSPSQKFELMKQAEQDVRTIARVRRRRHNRLGGRESRSGQT